MSKLPNAPLQEIIFELKWKVSNKADLSNFQFLSSDLHSSLREKYPFRQSLIPPEVPIDILINNPVYRFRSKENEYPLYQIGPGILSLNSNDENYYWQDFYDWSKELLDSFLKAMANSHTTHYIPSLIYLDFFEFSFKESDVYGYLNKNFNLNVSQDFYKPIKNPNNINLGFHYETHLGNLTVNFKRGKNTNQNEGIVVQTSLNGLKSCFNITEILEWLDESHEFCSNLFKNLTQGSLYQSFK